mmetsp:Transcript_19255/g.64925  ORF Transcript_19255/g.64925 Transcript_19255/m.64925 type:complete len:264 (+) Transcript_19255:2156-2947(+)
MTWICGLSISSSQVTIAIMSMPRPLLPSSAPSAHAQHFARRRLLARVWLPSYTPSRKNACRTSCELKSMRGSGSPRVCMASRRALMTGSASNEQPPSSIARRNIESENASARKPFTRISRNVTWYVAASVRPGQLRCPRPDPSASSSSTRRCNRAISICCASSCADRVRAVPAAGRSACASCASSRDRICPTLRSCDSNRSRSSPTLLSRAARSPAAAVAAAAAADASPAAVSASLLAVSAAAFAFAASAASRSFAAASCRAD